MAATVSWTFAALRDVERAADYIAQDSPAYAAAFTRRVLSATESASRFPEAGAIVEEFEAMGVREVFVDRYRVIYECKHDVLTILAVIHGARDLKRAIGDRV